MQWRGGWFPMLAILAAVALPAPDGLFAQPGTVSGQVTDTQGQPIGFAQVGIEGTDLGTVADAQGRYTIRGAPAGTHAVRAEFLGYRAEVASVTVAPGDAASQDFSLGRDYLGMETIVATAEREPRLKLETSTAITTLSARDIEQKAARSTADLLQAVPGFYVESSGGNVQGNLFARGLPADGSFRYVALMEEGMPVYDATELFFVNADIFVRVDEQIERLEAVRGGSAALFSSNAPGGLVNFISRTGGPVATGVVKVKGGTDGLGRIDAHVDGPMGESGWRYSIGGFYRYDDGIRDPGFTASEGGQIKVNVTRDSDRGFVRLYGKYLNDSNIFYLPLPLRNPPDPEFVAGFPDDGTLTSTAGADRSVPLPGGGSLPLNLEDGVHQDGYWVQADFGYDLANGWSIENKFRWMDLDHGNNAMVSGDLAVAEEWAQGFVDDTPGATDFRLTFADTGMPFTSANGLVHLGLQWRVDKPLDNVSDQFLIQKDAGRHQISVGTYLGRHQAENLWSFNNYASEVAGAPRFVDLEILGPGGEVVRRVTDEGYTQYNGLYVEADGTVDLYSFFFGDQIELGETFDLDLGARFEHNSIEHTVSNTETFDLPGGTDAHTGVSFRDGTVTVKDDEFSEWAFSVGGNYRITERVALFGRGTSGYKMPHLDQYLFSNPGDLETEGVDQIEGGLKVASPRLGLSAVAYWLRLTDFPSQDARIDPDTGEPVFETTFAGEARTVGTEIEVVTAPVENVRLNGTLTLQSPEYQDFVTGGEDFSGNRVRRIPEVIFNLQGEIDIPLESSELTLVGAWDYIGERFSNNANTIVLDGYGLLRAGADYRLPLWGVTFSVDVQNLTDAGPEALTEGNPRVDESLGAAGTFFLARPVLPRRVTAGLSYEF